MARSLLFVAVALALVAGVYGHARLLSPVPWNRNPSTNSPCGGATKLASTATWVQGSTVTIQWQLIAGDGAGSVSITLDTLGTSNPVGSAGSQTPVTFSPATTAGNLATYSYSFTVPVGVTCPSSGCTIQVTSANWFSCATVNIVSASAAAASSNTALATSCVQATGLSFCSMMNGYKVIVPTSANLAELDTQATNAWNNNLDSSLVFVNPTSSACAAEYKSFLCFNTFPLCGTNNGVCQDACNNVVSACGLQASHANLYNCGTYATSSCTNAASVAGCCTPGQGFGIFLLVVTLLGLVGFIGAMVYWRGNNRPRYDYVKAAPGRWMTSIKGVFGY
jgi:hypothetical protein